MLFEGQISNTCIIAKQNKRMLFEGVRGRVNELIVNTLICIPGRMAPGRSHLHMLHFQE